MDSHGESGRNANAESAAAPRNVQETTLAFLFTDIEGSTALLRERPAAMHAAQAWHDALLRRAVERHGGDLFSDGGDGICAAFATVGAAVRTALDCQREMLRQPKSEVTLRVRMGVHAGAVERAGRDYRGLALHHAARLMAAGHGGQILLSQTAVSLCGDAMPPGASVTDLGTYRLKDLGEPARIYQLRHPEIAGLSRPGFPHGFPPLRTLDSIPNNLPRQLTTFIGREREMAAVKELVATSCLVTLTGAGGSGKTRLALQAASDLSDSFPGGVYFVDLAVLVDGTHVDQTVARALGVESAASLPPLQAAIDAIGSRRILLLLDNCEHVCEAAARTARELLQACPNARLLATGRRTLGLRGEKTWRVPTLGVPAEDAAPDPDALRRCESVQLFESRAADARDGFRLTARNAAAVAQICRRLDGIPLAIELAAVRVRALSPEQMAMRLHQRFALLVDNSGNIPDRQRTLEAMIAWSYDLLPPREQAMYRSLAVFAGGCTLDAAAHVCRGPDGGKTGDADRLDDIEVLNGLDNLVGHSMLLAEDGPDGERRYRMLETIREYALKLLEERDESDGVCERHRDYFLQLAEEAEPNLGKPDQREWLDRLSLEHDNLRAALKLPAPGVSRLRMAVALNSFWLARGHIREGLGWTEHALSHARATNSEGSEWVARALNATGLLRAAAGDYPGAEAALMESARLYECLCHPEDGWVIYNNLGKLAAEQGRLEAAEGHFKKSLEIVRARGDLRKTAILLNNLGGVAKDREAFAEAGRCFAQSLSCFRELGDETGVAWVRINLAQVSEKCGSPDEARAHFVASAEIFARIDHSLGMALSLAGLSAACTGGNDPCRAARLLGATEALVRASEGSIPPSEMEDVGRARAALDRELGQADMEALIADGARLAESTPYPALLQKLLG